MTTSANRSLDGCLFEAELVSAPVATSSPQPLPERVDLRQYCSPVEDQGKTKSCTANAVVGAMEYHQRRFVGKHVDLSRLFAYFNARKLADTELDDCGSLIHHAMAAVLAFGICEEQIWPFHPMNCLVTPPPEAYQNAAQYQAVQYARTPLGPSAMAALAEGIPVVFGTYMPSEFYSIAEQTGAAPPPGPRNSPLGGGHAMLLVGYDMPNQHWIVRNSWGAGFGDNGYFRVPFATLQAYSVPEHFWTIGAIDKSERLNLQSASTPMTVTVPSHLDIDLRKLRAETRSKLENDLSRSRDGFRSRLRS